MEILQNFSAENSAEKVVKLAKWKFCRKHVLLESSRTQCQKPLHRKVNFYFPSSAGQEMCTAPSHLWIEIFTKSHILFCWKVAGHNFRIPLLAKFDFFVPSSGGRVIWVKTVNRIALSHLWIVILPKITYAYFVLLESSRTQFQKTLVRKVSFLCAIIWRQRNVSEDRLPHCSISYRTAEFTKTHILFRL